MLTLKQILFKINNIQDRLITALNYSGKTPDMALYKSEDETLQSRPRSADAVRSRRNSKGNLTGSISEKKINS